MNIHVPDSIRDKYPNFDFRGKQFVRKNRTMIEAYHTALGKTFYYSFEEDFFWFADCELPDWMMKRG